MLNLNTFSSLRSDRIASRLFSSVTTLVGPVLKPTRITLLLTNRLPHFNGKGELVNLNYFRSFVKAFHVNFAFITSKHTFVHSCCLITSAYVVLCFALTSTFYTFINNNRITLFIPYFLQTLLSTVSIPVQSPMVEGCYGEVHSSQDLKGVYSIVSKWDNATFVRLFQGTIFSDIFVDENSKSNKEFYVLWSSFLVRLEDQSAHTNLFDFADCVNTIFSDLHTVVYRKDCLGLSSFSTQHSVLDK